MEIAIGLVGLGLGVVTVVFAYIWRANGRYIKMLRDEIAQDSKMLQQALTESTRVLQEGQKESARVLQEGQKEIVRGLERIADITISMIPHKQ